MTTQYKYTRKELEDWSAHGSTWKKFANVTKRNNKYYLGERQIIPVEDHKDFLMSWWDSRLTGYAGRDGTYSRIAESYAGISRRDVADFLARLETSQVHQQPKSNVKVSRPIVLKRPMVSWSCDLTWLKRVSVDSTESIEKDSQVVFTCLDQFSKYAWARILPNKTAKTVIAAMRKVIEEAGAPKVLRTDNGSEFISGEFQDLLKEFHIKHVLGRPYSPQDNDSIAR